MDLPAGTTVADKIWTEGIWAEVSLRDRFHGLTDDEVRSLLVFAGLTGGVLMTSDKLDEISTQRADLFASLLREETLSCEFPELGSVQPLIVQRVTRSDGTGFTNFFNIADKAQTFGADGPRFDLQTHASLCVSLEPDAGGSRLLWVESRR